MEQPVISRRSVLSLAGAFGAVAVLASCSGSPQSSNGAFTYRLATQYEEWLNDLKWLPAVESRSGVKVKLVDGGDNDNYYQKLDLAMSSGNVQDAMIASYAQAAVYGAQGAFQDLTPLIKEHGPNIQAYIDKNKAYRDLVTSGDKIYGLFTEQPKLSGVTFYRADHYEKAGITPGATIDVAQFTDQLQSLKSYFGSKVSNYFPLSGRDTFLKLAYGFGAQDRIDSSGTVHGEYAGGTGVDATSDNTKQLIEWLRELFAKGLIDPEWVNGTATEDTWQEKMLQGKASVSDDFFTRPEYFMENGGPKNDPDFAMKVLPAFVGTDGTQMMRPDAIYVTGRVFVINAKSSSGADIIKFIDYLFSTKGNRTMNYGVEGKSYKVVDGKPEYTVKFTVEGNKPVGTPAWNFLQDRLTFPSPADNTAYMAWMDPLTQSFAPEYFDKYVEVVPTIKYSADQLKKRSALQATVDPFVTAQLTKFVQGKTPMTEWGSFVSQAKSKGYDQIVAIDQAAYTAQSK